MPSFSKFHSYYQQAQADRLGALETMAAYRHLQGYYAKPAENREPEHLNPVVYHLISDPVWDAHGFRQKTDSEAVKYFSHSYRQIIGELSAGAKIRRPVSKSHRLTSDKADIYSSRNKKIGNDTLKKLREGMKQ